MEATSLPIHDSHRSCHRREVLVEMPGSDEAKVFVHKACVLHSPILAINAMQNAIPLIHGPTSCTYGYRVNFQTFLGEPVRIACSGMAESDVIFGATEKLRRSILDAYELYRPDLIAVITTCAADLMGEDVKGVVTEVSKQLAGCDVVYIGSGGFRGGSAGTNQGYGYHLAYNALLDLMEPPRVKIKNSINILGHVHPAGPGHDIGELIRPLRKIGIKVNCVLTSGSRVSDIKRLPEAELNVLRCENNARRTADQLQVRFGMPYTNLGMAPIGLGATTEWIMQVAEALKLEDRAKAVCEEEVAYARRRLASIRERVQGTKGAVFLSPGRCLPIARFLYEDLGIEPVAIYLLHYNEWVIDTLKEMVAGWDLEPRIVVEPEYTEMMDTLQRYGVGIALGGTVERQMCRSLGIPYVHEMVYEEPHHGYLGSLKLATEIEEAIFGAPAAAAKRGGSEA